MNHYFKSVINCILMAIFSIVECYPLAENCCKHCYSNYYKNGKLPKRAPLETVAQSGLICVAPVFPLYGQIITRSNYYIFTFRITLVSLSVNSSVQGLTDDALSQERERAIISFTTTICKRMQARTLFPDLPLLKCSRKNSVPCRKLARTPRDCQQIFITYEDLIEQYFKFYASSE